MVAVDPTATQNDASGQDVAPRKELTAPGGAGIPVSVHVGALEAAAEAPANPTRPKTISVMPHNSDPRTRWNGAGRSRNNPDPLRAGDSSEVRCVMTPPLAAPPHAPPGQGLPLGDSSDWCGAARVEGPELPPPRPDPTGHLAGPEDLGTALIEVAEQNPAQVPYLQVNNLSSLPVLLVEREMLIGVKQNRTMNITVMCPTRATTVVPVSCIEARRWSTGPDGSIGAKKRADWLLDQVLHRAPDEGGTDQEGGDALPQALRRTGGVRAATEVSVCS